MAKLPTIFVQIASYRDPECQWTVKDLFTKAKHPERVTVGICSQCSPEHDKDCFTEPSPRPDQTKIISVLPSESLGVCWARAKTQTLFKNQDYVLMIDSHMRFIPGWDTALISELARCDSKKPFLSTYPPGYKPPNQLDPAPKPVVMRAKPFTDQGDIRFEGESLAIVPEKPLRGAFLAGGFIFAPGAFVKEVPYDPHLYFDQEEITIAARAFTHGWDVFSPPGTFVYHYYNDPGKGEKRPTHWADNQDWGKLQQVSRARYNYLLAGIEPEGHPEALKNIKKYSLGKTRSLQEFEEFTGINFKEKTVSDRGKKSQFVEGIERYRQPIPIQQPAKNIRSDLAPLSVLGVGDLIPPFQMRDDTGAWREMHLFAGKPGILCLLPSAFDDYVRDFMGLYKEQIGRFKALGVRIIFVAPVPGDSVAGYKARNNIPQGVMADEGFGLANAFGMMERKHDTPCSYSFDANQKIAGIFSNRNAQNHIRELLRVAENLKTLAAKEPLRPPAYAPVLIVPDVLLESDRKKIIDYWEQGKKYAGTIGNDGKETIVAEGKRRVDVDVRDRDFLKEIDMLLSKRLFPEIRKVFALDVTCRDRYKIGLYTSEDQGFYNLHRDTGIPALAHRRVSVSFVLNDDFEGGHLVLPEYGPHASYRAPAGSAICFPSAVLHAVTPVTKGNRFIMVSFFHGDLEETWRKHYHDFVKKKYNPDEVHLLSEKTYPGLVYSHNFYTRNGV